MKEIKVWKISLIWLLIPQVAVFVLLMFMDVAKIENMSDVVLSFVMFTSILLTIFIVGRVSKKLVLNRYEDAKRKIKVKEIIETVLTQIVLSYGLSYLSLGVVGLNSEERALEMINENLGNPTNLMELVIFLITVIIVAPIVEEITFRRVLFTRFSTKLSFIPAALISSFLFGFGHIDLSILGAVIFGFVCCLLYRKYHNIGIPMIVHFMNNLIAGSFTCFAYFTGDLNEPITKITSSDIQAYLILGSGLTLISFIVFMRYLVKNKRYWLA